VVGKTVQLKPGESITLDYDVERLSRVSWKLRWRSPA